MIYCIFLGVSGYNRDPNVENYPYGLGPKVTALKSPKTTKPGGYSRILKGSIRGLGFRV